MSDFLIGALLGLVVAGGFWYLRRLRRGDKKTIQVDSHTIIEKLQSIGELRVFKVLTKEIVTAKDHWLGETGKRYFDWLTSTKKMVMIFDFEIGFSYDLTHPDFMIEEIGPAKFRAKMPRCSYEIYHRDITLYDEQSSRILPWLLGDLTQLFGGGFNEEDKNRLKDEARRQVNEVAGQLVGKLQTEVQTSARNNLEALARGFAVEKLLVEFADQEAAREQFESATAK